MMARSTSAGTPQPSKHSSSERGGLEMTASASGHTRLSVAHERRSMNGFCTTTTLSQARPRAASKVRDSDTFSPVLVASGSISMLLSTTPHRAASRAKTTASGSVQPSRFAPECGPVPMPPLKQSQPPSSWCSRAACRATRRSEEHKHRIPSQRWPSVRSSLWCMWAYE
eukprot:CAMPEP_0174759516 /NCGR_PEP_ID=MMETSP1094-20130205/108310_1 /TAXON_ID=156173 /ORGANISM="Chrysochromulina brevifilum, Strain UTEX LB 985" /LENGTH=168 /DNA_ID=CAMNT_0015965451 /DNA_START=159 /DNA_END=665 /DNA_ORIENTATION=+